MNLSFCILGSCDSNKRESIDLLLARTRKIKRSGRWFMPHNRAVVWKICRFVFQVVAKQHL